MRLTLKGIIPIPLKDKVISGKSGIWNTTATLDEGAHVFVQAPSGTGKTTLVHILYGLRRDYTGEVLWDGSTLTGLDTEKLADMRATSISVIFQDMRLFPELTAWENIDIKRRLTGTVSEAQAHEWIALLGLADKEKSLAATLSYGEQQRIAIIRSLVQPFRWLLMDEPFSHLDHNNTRKAIDLISAVVQQHKAGMILADLDENTFFPYTQTLYL